MPRKLTRNPPILYDQSMDKKLLIEKIETKIEEFKETLDLHVDRSTFTAVHGIIQGLELAIGLIEEE